MGRLQQPRLGAGRGQPGEFWAGRRAMLFPPRRHLPAPRAATPAGAGGIPAAARPGLEENRGSVRQAGGLCPSAHAARQGKAAAAPGDPSTHAGGPPWTGERRRQPPSPGLPCPPEQPRPRSGAIRGERVHEFLLLEIKFLVGSVLGRGVFL